MYRDEQVCLVLIRDCRARLKRDKGIVVPRVNHVGAQLVLEQLAKAQRDVEDEVLFLEAGRPDGSGIVPPVAGVYDDAADLEPQRADERALAKGGGLGFARGYGGRLVFLATLVGVDGRLGWGIVVGFRGLFRRFGFRGGLGFGVVVDNYFAGSLRIIGARRDGLEGRL